MLFLLFLSFLLPLLSTDSVKGVAPRSINIINSTTGLNSITLGNSTRPLPPGGIPFTLNISLSGQTTDLATWQVGITFDNNSLRCTNVSIPESDPNYVFHSLPEIVPQVDISDAAQSGAYTGGIPEIIAGAALMDVSNAVSVNNASLCTINFTAFKVGQKSETTIQFWPYKPATDTFLWDSNGVDIPFGNQSFSVNILEGAIVPDDYSTIQAAINGVNSGDSILVRSGAYHENVIVNKTVALVGENRGNTVIDGGGTGYVVGIKGVNNVTLSNFTIQNGQTGVYAGDWGASVGSSRGNIIQNTIRNNSDNGVFIGMDRYCVYNNDIEDNGIGLSIYAQGTVNGTIRGNDIKNSSRYNLEINSTVYDQLDMDTSNLVDSKPVYYWIRHLGGTVPSNAGQVTLVNCSDVTVQGLVLSKNFVNVEFLAAVNCTLLNSNSSAADVGVLLVDSKLCKLNNNTLTDCRISLQARESANNSVTENYFFANGFCAVDFDNSANNSFYHNNVNNLGSNYTVYRAGNTVWDDGYPSGGNYWSDYTGVDLNSGPNQNLIGSDGIGDTPYIIDANNSDHYPLVTKHSLLPVHNTNTGLDYPTIQAAIDAPETLNGHTIAVDPGIYFENLTINKSLSLTGDDFTTTVIDGSSNATVVNISANGVNLTGFTIRNSGPGYTSGGILVSSIGNNINHNRIEDNGGNGIYVLSSSNNNKINDNEVLNNTQSGIYILSNDNILSGNDIEGNHYYGVSLYSSDNNSLETNNIVDNNDYGISLHSSASNSILDNDVSGNGDGVFVWSYSYNNTFKGNLIEGNIHHGVWFDSSFNSSLISNNVVDNGIGVLFQSNSIDNSLVGNNFTGNRDCGLALQESPHNVFYHNNFANTVNVEGFQGLVNFWDNAYPSGGNYWSDQIGSDLFQGARQNETGSDGIIDVAHVLDENNTDFFPLTKPYSGPCDIGILQVNVSENFAGHLCIWVYVKIINYGEKTETFNVSLKANSTKIVYRTITLTSRNSTIITFVWNTTGVDVGNYTVTALADMLQGEFDTSDNNLTMNTTVFVTLPGDVTGPLGYPDGIVDAHDMQALIAKFNSRIGDSSWDPKMDVSGDGIVNIRDITWAILSSARQKT
jgi:parallel beta-helix repeat protein